MQTEAPGQAPLPPPLGVIAGRGALPGRLAAHALAQGREVFVQDCYAGADPRYRINVRVITEHIRPLLGERVVVQYRT